ncbi:MAG: DNA-formamidopyrimidine glycosylase family protein [Candidatus Binatus sp.]|uniref:Fpg/Nei family DNA glycosylase n=1 Tax=Candidatus Binatus sp. TaxID=2811406 RepID=UPI0027209432|nr:DNA-formamidopyrimidine glycosylase family protein [Candidatus Binatus sp.]MDO8435028.1 DNA-formamidopyrimidine glycosylase family protein [Candidatus Binatus sp.]
MPELPDITLYVEALSDRVIGRKLKRTIVRSPFLLRSASPPLSATDSRIVSDVRRIGKQIAIGLDNNLWLVLHLRIAGRLHWKPVDSKPGRKGALATFEFDNGALTFTEAGTQHRASLHVVEGDAGIQAMTAGGIEPLETDLAAFTEVLRSANHTLKRALTDPSLISGIGNAYSDEILHRAQLSPLAMTQKLTPQDIEKLYLATQATLGEWIDRLRSELAGAFPEKVTAFHPAMAVHGRYGELCPRCGAKVQRIRYASNETNYCAACQTGGRLLADRALSRLLHEDWPATLEELEKRKNR